MEPSRPKDRRGRTLMLVAGIIAIGLAAVVILKNRKPSAEEVARRLDSCFQNLDAGCLLDNTWPQSVKLAGWTRESLSKFLNSEVGPIVNSAKKADLKLEPLTDQGLLMASREYTTKEGRKAVFSVQVFATESVPKSDSITALLLTFVTDAKRAWGMDPLSRFTRRHAWLQLGKEKLGPLGIRGLEQRNKTGIIELRPWDDALALNEQRLQILRNEKK